TEAEHIGVNVAEVEGFVRFSERFHIDYDAAFCERHDIKVGQEHDIGQVFGSRLRCESLRCVADDRLQADLNIRVNLVEVLNEQVLHIIDEGSGQRTEAHRFLLRSDHIRARKERRGEQKQGNGNFSLVHGYSSIKL